MSTLQESGKFPEYGVALFFYPDGDKNFKAQLNWAQPEGITEDQANFYQALAHGLMSIAVNETQQVCAHGIQVINAAGESQAQEEGVAAIFDEGTKAFDNPHHGHADESMTQYELLPSDSEPQANA